MRRTTAALLLLSLVACGSDAPPTDAASGTPAAASPAPTPSPSPTVLKNLVSLKVTSTNFLQIMYFEPTHERPFIPQAEEKPGELAQGLVETWETEFEIWRTETSIRAVGSGVPDDFALSGDIRGFNIYMYATGFGQFTCEILIDGHLAAENADGGECEAEAEFID